MAKSFRSGVAALLSCGLLAACDLPSHDRAAPIATLAPDLPKIEKRLALCEGTLSGLETTIRANFESSKSRFEQNRVVQVVMRAIQRRKAIALRAIVRSADDDDVAAAIAGQRLQADLAIAASDGPSTQKAKILAKLDQIIEHNKAGRLTLRDFQELYEVLLTTRAGEIAERVVRYEAAYLNGNFVDRFGTKWDAPKPSWKVSDDQITESLTVLLEALADEIFTKTPVWYELPAEGKGPKPAAVQPIGGAASEKGDGRKYYPGGKTDKPTFLSLASESEVKSLQVEMDKLDGSAICGMTPLKMDALIFLSNKASTLAAGQSGLLLGGFGGTTVGLPIVMGKLSVGDNQTLQAMFKALVAYIAKRGTYEAAWHVLLHVDEKRFGGLGEMVGKVVLKPGDDDDKDERPTKPKS